MIIDDKLEIQDEQVELLPVVEFFATTDNQTQTTLPILSTKKEPDIYDKNELIEKLTEDLSTTRNTLKTAIEMNSSTLNALSDRLRDGLEEAPNNANNIRLGEILARLFESLTSLNSQYLNSSRQFVDVIEKLHNMGTDKKEGTNIQTANIQNAVFTGTLQDLMRKI